MIAALNIFPLIAFAMTLFEGLPLYFYREPMLSNFGDVLSIVIVERIVGRPVRVHQKGQKEKKFLAIGSIFYFASDGDVIWGSGINGKTLKKSDYRFSNLDVRAVRGPLTRQFLMENFGIMCPEIYGDPALLIPYLFPEFKRKENPKYDYIIIPHYREISHYPKQLYPNAVYPTEPWYEIIEKILDSRFVISNSLHGIAVAESFGIPARMIPIPEKEFLFKFQDYYLGTGRSEFRIASSIEEALRLGGEPPIRCDLRRLYEAFPFEYWSGLPRNIPSFR